MKIQCLITTLVLVVMPTIHFIDLELKQVVTEALSQANISESSPSAVAVMVGPVLSLCLHS